LRRLTTHNPRKRARLAALTGLTARRPGRLDQASPIPQSRGSHTASALVLTGGGAARLHEDADGRFVEWVRRLEVDRFGVPVPDAQLLLRRIHGELGIGNIQRVGRLRLRVGERGQH